MTRWDLIVGQMQSLQVWEAPRNELEVVNGVVLQIEFLKGVQVHKLLHAHVIVRNVQICKVFKKLEVFLGHVVDVHTREF